MIADKYGAFDVHDATTFPVVRDGRGAWLFESVLKTGPEAISDFLRGLSGRVALTFEEGTHAAWLFDLTSPLVSSVLVCNPRQNRQGPKQNKTDRIDATKLSDWLVQAASTPSSTTTARSGASSTPPASTPNSSRTPPA